ncbi:hypothetical protein BDP27DRAFT_1371270 [Rhodocollybia butyracea]|uniref:Uncharacterized protein n=1 Tax=Rhodocollybia butyracea TaxID=206335 RepID=A0A9P5TZN2_9AGAR|nr:hypothetical protein BDP27DRAFT_1371270 [Rhodocollybia butyracea]
MIQQLHLEFLELFTSSSASSYATDHEIKLLCPQIRHLFSQLTLLSLFEQAVMRWRIAQRMILLVEAQITWLTEVLPTFAEPDAWKVHTLRNVVGAVTEDPLAVERLYRAGIPVWFYCSLNLEPSTKVQRWADDNKVHLRVPYSWISFDDDTPVWPTVYNGSVQASQDRYRKMAVECWTIAFPAAIFGADLIQNGVHYSTVQPSASSSQSTGGPSSLSQSTRGPSSSSQIADSGPSRLSSACSFHTRTPSMDRSSQPHKKQKTGKNPPVVQCSKFLEPNSPIMPHAFPQWIKAAESASAKFKLSEYPCTGVNRGYVLPEPAVFANHENETSCQQYFLTYLKVREVFIAAISLLGPVVCQRSPKDWRRLVSLELHGSLNTETNKATAKLELCQEMNKVAARMGSSFSIDLTNLSQNSSRWKGHTYNYVPDDVQREQEFLLLDRFLYRLVPRHEDHGEHKYDASTREDRNLIIEDVLFSDGPPPFNHPDPRVRQDTLHAFFQIMKGWTRSVSPMHPKTVDAGERLGSEHLRGTGELKDTEYVLAYFYIYTFAHFFRQAPIMPHFI